MVPTSEERLIMAQYSRVGVLLHEKETLRVLWANERACEMFQYSVEELRALKAHHMSSQNQRFRREDGVAWLNSAALYGSSRKRWTYLDAEGREFLTEAVATVVPLRGQEVIMVEMRLVSARDEPLESTEWISTSLERIVSHTASGVFVLDTENHVERASPYAASLFDLTADEIIGKNLTELGVTDSGFSDDQLRKSVQQPEGRVNFRMKVKVAENDLRWLACYLETVQVEESTYRVLTARDITDRVQAEKREEAHRSQLQYLSRYNAMGDMAMILAHELGQPLAASLNYLSGVKSRLGTPETGPEKIKYGIEMVEKQLKRASEIVSSAKRYVRRIESTVSTFSLLDTVEESLYFVRLRAEEKGVEVKTELGSDPLRMEGEGVLIGQVIINLCVNAIDEISRPETSVKELDLKLSRHGDAASIAVSDLGRGMSEAPADRLAAGPFSSKEDGSGIGLIISEHIAQRHGGSIIFTPNHPRGTVATLSLPLQPAETAEA